MDPVDRFEEEGQTEQIAADETISRGMDMYRKLNEEQRTVVDAVMESVQKGNVQAPCFFIDGPGGTGKTYTYDTLLSYAWSRSQSEDHGLHRNCHYTLSQWTNLSQDIQLECAIDS
jgi:hypothetical protein